MGLFDKLKKKSANSAGTSNGKIDISMNPKVMSVLQEMVNELYLPHLNKKFADPNVKNAFKKLNNLDIDEELKAYYIIMLLKKDLRERGITEINGALLTILKDTFGISAERGAELIEMVED